MRVFLVACIAIIVLACGAVFSLGAIQQSTAAAFSTDGTRIDPSWAAHPDGTLSS